MNDTIVMQLVSKVLDSGCTPEEACRDTPELLEEVREQLRRIRSIDMHVDGLFPESGSDVLDEARDAHSLEALPHVPGHEVLSVLGHGGMGVVYEARHLRLNRIVAVKMLLCGAHTDTVNLKRLLREAEAVAALRHPNIVQVHEVGEHEGLPYFTMELVEGGSLRDKIEAKVFDAREAASLVATLAEAMEVAHQSGVVHRDLKPANVLLTLDGVPKIVDFGLALRMEGESSLTLSDARLGTPSYMAPEQAQGGSLAVGPPADVYALGAILYSALTGRPPFKSDMNAFTLMQVIADEPVRPSHLNPRVPRDLETICLECLSKDPARRYASAAALAADLRRFVRGEPILARPVGFLERARKWVRRRPAHATIAAGSVLAVVALVGAFLWLGIQRGNVVRAAEGDLRAVDVAAAAADWAGARTAVEKARARVADGGFDDLRLEIDRCTRELDLVGKLDAIRLKRLAVADGKVDPARNDAETDIAYEKAFLEVGLADVPARPSEIAERVRSSRIRSVLVSALDTWATCVTKDPARRDGLASVARLADPDPTGWRDRVRDPANWNDGPALVESMRAAPASGESVALLLALAGHAARAGEDAVPFLTRIQQQYPDDFGSNYELGAALTVRSPAVAVRYFQTAAAVQPDSAVAQEKLGSALAESDQIDEAIVQLRKAVAIDPDYALAHMVLGRCLTSRAQHPEAILELQAATRLDPTLADAARFHIAKSLIESARVDEAAAEFRAILEVDPRSSTAHYGLGCAFHMSGLLAEAADELRQAIALDPRSARQHEFLGKVHQASGKLDEAIACLREATRIDPVKFSSRWSLIWALIAKGRFEEARTEATVLYQGRAAGDPDRPLAKAGLDHCVFLADLAANLPEVLDGTRKPGNAAECIAFADVFRAQNDPARAARFFADAFERDPAITGQHGGRRLFDAARCAALAGAVEDGATHVPADDERAKFRNMAYGWLRRDFNVLERMIAKGTAGSKRFVLLALVDTRSDPALAGVRDAASLDRLPPDEQYQWRELWSDADSMSERARTVR